VAIKVHLAEGVELFSLQPRKTYLTLFSVIWYCRFLVTSS